MTMTKCLVSHICMKNGVLQSSRSPTNTNNSTSVRRTGDVRHVPPPIRPILTSTSTNLNQLISSKPDDNINHPEDIAVRPHSTKESSSAIPIRPTSIRNQSPTVSHCSFKLPPEGYTPIGRVNSDVSFPPSTTRVKHPCSSNWNVSALVLLRVQVPFTSGSSARTDHEGRKCTPEIVDRDSNTFHSMLSRQARTRSGPSKSKYSGASTFIYESILPDPPDLDDMQRNENKEMDDFTEGVRKSWSFSRASAQSERMASKMRCVNPDTVPPFRRNQHS